MDFSNRAGLPERSNRSGWFGEPLPLPASKAVGADLTARTSAVMRVLPGSLLCGLPILGVLSWPAGYRREALVIWVVIALIGLLYFPLARGWPRAAFCGLVATLIAYAVAGSSVFGSIRGTGIYALFGAVRARRLPALERGRQ